MALQKEHKTIHFTFWLLRSIESAENREHAQNGGHNKEEEEEKKHQQQNDEEERPIRTEKKKNGRVKQAIKIKSIKIGETS